MRFMRADRLSSVRTSARPAVSRHTIPDGYDATASYLALGAPFLGIALMLLATLIPSG